MPHQHSVYDTNLHFKIDPVTRAITSESTAKLQLMQYDHNSERATFEIPRLADDHDMSQCSKIEVHFINIAADKTGQHTNVYPVDDMQISPNSDDVVIFSWLISQNATQFAGTLNFLVRFVCVTGKTIDYIWNSGVFKGISISDGMDNGEAVVEEYTDILATWEASIAAIESIGKEHAEVLANHQEQLANHQEQLDNHQEQFATHQSVISDLDNDVQAANNALANCIQKQESEYEENVYMQDADGNIDLHRVDYRATEYAVVRRNSTGDILLKEKTSYPKNSAVPFSYIRDTMLAPYAEASKVEEVEDKVSFLEGALIDYVEDSSAAYEKQIPAGVADKAILNSAQGLIGLINLYQGKYAEPEKYDIYFDNTNSYWLVNNCFSMPEGKYTLRIKFTDLAPSDAMIWARTYCDGGRIISPDGTESYGDFEFVDGKAYLFIELYSHTDISLEVCSDYWHEIEMTGTLQIELVEGHTTQPLGNSTLTSIDIISPNSLDYTKLLPASDIIENGIRITDYYMYGVPSLAALKQLLGVAAGDVITVSAKVQVHDISGNYSGTPCPYLCYEGPEQSFRIDLCESGHTVTIPEDFEYGLAYITSGLDLEFTGGSNGSYIDVTEIMVVKGTEKHAYVPYSTEPISKFVIPSQIQQIAEQSKENCVINFTDKVVIADGKTIDIAPYLTDYANHKMLEVRPGAIVRFANQAEAPVQSTIIYAKPKGG